MGQRTGTTEQRPPKDQPPGIAVKVDDLWQFGQHLLNDGFLSLPVDLVLGDSLTEQ